jgi:hypothetical protein
MRSHPRPALRAAVALDSFEIPTDGGHIDGVTQIALAAKPIAEFLAR